jgi:hypothetical protein
MISLFCARRRLCLFVVPLFGSDLTTRLLVGVVFVRISVRVVFGSVKTGTARNDNSPFQANTILAIRESDKQVRRMKRSINALTENIYAIDMDVKINQDLNMFIDEIRTFGEVMVNTRVHFLVKPGRLIISVLFL